MEIKKVYLGLAIAGTVIPYAAFIPWLMENSIAPVLFVEEMFANRISSFFALDVLLSALAVIVAALYSAGRGMAGLWQVLAATMLVGVSAGLPLYLYYQSRHAGEA